MGEDGQMRVIVGQRKGRGEGAQIARKGQGLLKRAGRVEESQGIARKGLRESESVEEVQGVLQRGHGVPKGQVGFERVREC